MVRLNIIKERTMEKSEAMFRGLFEGANLSGAQVIVNNEGTVTYHQRGTTDNMEHFPLDGDVAEGRKVFQQLVDNGFIAKDTDESSFLFVMGYSAETNGNVKQIVWLKTKQLAREFVKLKNEKAIESGQLKIAAMEKLTEQLFLMDGKPLKLAKNKPVPSLESDLLEKIVRP